MVDDSSGRIARMGKTGDAIKAVAAAAAIVVAAVKDPFHDCRNVTATDCPPHRYLTSEVRR
jgi:hypothetical protein